MPVLRVPYKPGMSLHELERLNGVVGDVADYPDHYIGIPRSRYYSDEELDFAESHESATRALKELTRVLDRLGIR